MNYVPPHRITDVVKFNSMIETLENGRSLPPIIVCGDIAFSGTHRLAAWKAKGMQPDVIEITDEDVTSAKQFLGIDRLCVGQFNDLIDALIELGIIPHPNQQPHTRGMNS